MVENDRFRCGCFEKLVSFCSINCLVASHYKVKGSEKKMAAAAAVVSNSLNVVVGAKRTQTERNEKETNKKPTQYNFCCVDNRCQPFSSPSAQALTDKSVLPIVGKVPNEMRRRR